MEPSFSRRAQMLRWPEPELLQQRREIVRTQLEVRCVFSQAGVHTAGLAVRLPRLRFDDERAARCQRAVRTTEQRGDALVAVVEMDPFRDGEAEGASVGRSVQGNGPHAITTSYSSSAGVSWTQSVVRKVTLCGKASLGAGMGSGPWLCSQDMGK